MAIEIVSCPMKNMVNFHSYVSHYQRVSWKTNAHSSRKLIRKRKEYDHPIENKIKTPYKIRSGTVKLKTSITTIYNRRRDVASEMVDKICKAFCHCEAFAPSPGQFSLRPKEIFLSKFI